MDSRREFLKKAGLLAGGVMVGSVPESVRRAFAIDPEPGSTYLDAEYIVILMQENRSFDHTYGCLQGVRGYNDPHPLELPDGNPCWLQTDEHGKTYAPFRLNMWETSATWMDSLPHGWNNQTDARNGGRYDKWLPNKHNSIAAYHDMPLTLGYYNRVDIPFYYALADAFTVCDGNYCSSLTGTNPNRLHLWTGTVREKQEPTSKACILNDDVGYPIWVKWTTFPERLEDAGVSWKIYQNEVDLNSGLSDDENFWLGNFQDNPMEWFEQFGVPFRKTRRAHAEARSKELPGEIEALKQKLATASDADKAGIQSSITDHENELKLYQSEAELYSDAKWDAQTEHQKNLHRKGFVCNDADPNFRKLTEIAYEDGDQKRTVKVPDGDVFYEFRKDVQSGKLPTVSWLVAPESFSDHPSSAWYGAWYVSEALDILTQNPEIWKKTIFILCYDENDGYFDHVPPFVAPNPKKPETGRTTGIDTSVDFVELSEDLKHHSPDDARESSIGLGFRVPLVVASPWSRGGVVNSETFDHTSIIQFVERFLTHKTGKPIREHNISEWRRCVCGDLHTVFQPYRGETIELPKFVERDEFVEAIDKSKYKKLPDAYRSLNQQEIEEIKLRPRQSVWMPRQEQGNRPACALPYELHADGFASSEAFHLELEAGNKRFGRDSLSAAFSVYAYAGSDVIHRCYAVKAGQKINDLLPMSMFAGGQYRVRIDGPNGFYREFRGPIGDAPYVTTLEYSEDGSYAKLHVGIEKGRRLEGSIKDLGYGGTYPMSPAGIARIDTAKSQGWYDFSISAGGTEKRFAGHIENGRMSRTDPAMA